MKSCRRFIQNIYRFSGTAFAKFCRKFNSLCLATWKLCRRLSQTNIRQSDISQRLHLSSNAWHVFEEIYRFFHCHIQYIINIFPFIAYFQRLTIVTLSTTDLARYINIRQKMHLDFQDSASCTCFATSPFNIKAKPSFLISTRFCIWCSCKQISDQIKYACISSRIRPWCPSDWWLVDINHFINLL